MIPPHISKEKIKSIREENANLSLDYIEEIATPILTKLTEWANSTVYSKYNGRITLEIRLQESAEAWAITRPSDPMNPTIRMHVGMLREIYRDAFVFPLISHIIAEESSTIINFNKIHKNLRYTFKSGVPTIPVSQQTELFKLLKPLYDKNRHKKLTDDMLASRFLMFELMTVWLFCHELGHLIQRHYLLQVIDGDEDISSISEAQDDLALHSKDTDENFFLKSQAREILADLEGVGLAVTYMIEKKLLSMPSIYMLLCAQEIMFQRFAVIYPDNFDIPDLKHPNPIIRSEFVQAYSVHFILDALVQRGRMATKGAGVDGMLYLSQRSSLMAGLFWANRYEVFDENNRPKFLRLSDKEHQESKLKYLKTMAHWIDEQISHIRPNHLMEENFLEYFQGLKLFKHSDSATSD